MKYIKIFEDFSLDSNIDEQEIKDLIIGKPITINSDEQHSNMPKGNITFIVKDCILIKNTKGKYLFVYVPESDIKGTITNTYKGSISDNKALCMAMTSWLAFNDLKDYLGDFDILVYTVPVEEGMEEFFTAQFKKRFSSTPFGTPDWDSF